MSDSFIDHKPFLSDNFDVNAYANAVLAGKVYRPDDAPLTANGHTGGSGSANATAGASGSKSRGNDDSGRVGGGGDVSVELVKLNYGIEDVTKQLRHEISTNYPLLLSHLTTSLSLSNHLAPIRSSLGTLSTSLDRLQAKIHTPQTQLALLVRRLTLLAQASDLARRASRFVLLCRRLEGQMERVRGEGMDGSGVNGDGDGVGRKAESGEGEKERELAKAALSVAELDSLLQLPETNPDPLNPSETATQTQTQPLPLQSLNFITSQIPIIESSKDLIIQEMESMVISGLGDLNQPLLSSSLQTAHNLRLLPDLVSNLLADLNDAVTQRVSRAFDTGAIGKEVASQDGGSGGGVKFGSRGGRGEPTNANLGIWVAVLWSRLERVVEDVANCCIKVYTLEKVLKLKKDATTGIEFLDEVMKTLDDKPSFSFWTTLAKAFETQTKEAARSSAWLQTALSTGYPRLLRLFHDFFAKIAVHTDTVYTRDHQSPEAVLVLRSVSTFESLYLTRSTTRMNESVSTALSNYQSLTNRGTPPGPSEGVSIARTITNELDSARFDPLLVRTVARNAIRVIDTFVARIEGLLYKDFTATSMVGPNATASQVVNACLVGCLYQCWWNLIVVEEDFPRKVWEIMKGSVESIATTYKRTTTALDTAFKREFSSVLSKIHRVDFSKPVDPMSMMMNNGGGGSPYMQDMIDKLAFVKSEILGRMSMGEFMRDWVLELSKYLLKVFLLHASIARPMGESGKLKLTGDMTELEVAISSLLTTGQVTGSRGGMRVDKIGEEYLALRAFRTLLFSDISTLTNPVETVHLPPLIVLHHIIVLSPLRLPHEVHGWSEQEYLLWLQKHDNPSEHWDLLEKAVDDQVVNNNNNQDETHGKGDKDEKEDNEGMYLQLIKEVLDHARRAVEEDHSPGHTPS